MTPSELKGYRDRARLSQTAMAKMIGLGLRAYQEVEAGTSELNIRNLVALERQSLSLAVTRKDVGLALPDVAKEALNFAALVNTGPLVGGDRVIVYSFVVWNHASAVMIPAGVKATMSAIRKALGKSIAGSGLTVPEQDLDEAGFYSPTAWLANRPWLPAREP